MAEVTTIPLRHHSERPRPAQARSATSQVLQTPCPRSRPLLHQGGARRYPLSPVIAHTNAGIMRFQVSSSKKCPFLLSNEKNRASTP